MADTATTVESAALPAAAPASQTSNEHVPATTPSLFLEFQTTIPPQDGLVLAWLTRDNTKPIIPVAGSALHTRFGSFPHNAMISARYGTQLPSSSSTQAGFIHLLHATPELWSMSLPHRTQIVYTPDASFIVQRLRIRPRSVVLEAGTGSASFTHALARTVGKRGRVWTFEFHQPRYEMARKEIEEHGLAGVVKCSHGDVCQNGFIPADVPAGTFLDASAVFLDLPSPWLAIPHLSNCISKTKITRICCFSPCMEQVQRTIESLHKEGWLDIEMVEVSCKRWESRMEMVRHPDDAIERLRDINRRRIEGLRKRDERKARDNGVVLDNVDVSPDPDTTTTKRKAEDDGERPPKPYLPTDYNPWGKGKRIREGEAGYEWANISKVEAELKTHTSYLTFAYKPPPILDVISTVNEEEEDNVS
ncbi:tRNA methyltransferase complex GCD14 subunit-domain-containing protein [Limtongia smithiae]|uniref:tRNA methyltransferase complex GCD14 subunit-domain-containing protein n=1 Tax=Limtongia smithiae TaxID=1125753 RepID=UPI0034CD53D8